MNKPIATVINNNQPGWTNIVETEPNVTLLVGTKLCLYTEPSVDLEADLKQAEAFAIELEERANGHDNGVVYADQWEAAEAKYLREQAALVRKLAASMKRFEELYDDAAKAGHAIGVKLAETEYRLDELRVHHNDLKGLYVGKVCDDCNYLERSVCYEQREAVEQKLERAQIAIGKFFELLDYKEESDSGREFHPIVVSCCRVMMMDQVAQALEEMKKHARHEK